jgi:multicomponent Na+:H+ antiporter subunit F
MTATTVLYIAAGVLFSLAAGFAVVRIVRGPTILDRVIASDVLLTVLVLVVGAEMVIDGHTRTIPIMLVLTGTAALSTIAVARYVSKQDTRRNDPPEGES